MQNEETKVQNSTEASNDGNTVLAAVASTELATKHKKNELKL